jgi:hypothetical protein
VPELYPYQQEAVHFVNACTAAHGAALVADDMGCIDGDALIPINRAGKGFKIRLRELFIRFHGGKTGNHFAWDPTIPTRVRALCGPHIRLHEIRDVVQRGVRSVVLLRTEAGKTLRLTPDHEVATGLGEFARADALKVGSVVLTNGIPACSDCGATDGVVTSPHAKFPGTCRRCIYRSRRAKPTWSGGRSIDDDGYVRVSGHRNHPRANRAGQVYEHILVMEAALGRYVGRGEHVHHVNRNKADNRIENLELKSGVDHVTEHGRDGAFLHMDGGVAANGGAVLFLPRVDRVASIEPAGEIEVFDIVCADPHRNFVANGVIVHNCGKTPAGIASIDRGRPLLLAIPACLRGNWTDEFARWAPGAWALHHVESIGAFRWPRVGECVVVSRELLASPKGELVRLERDLQQARKDADGALDFAKATMTEAAERKLAQARKRAGPSVPPPAGMDLLIDEAHVYSNNKSVLTQRMRAVVKATRKAGGRVVGMTATPVLNDPPELQGLLTTLGLHRAAFPGGWWEFMRLFGGAKSHFGTTWEGEPRDAEIADALRRVSIRRLLDDVQPGIPPYRQPRMLPVDVDASVLALEADAARDPRLAPLYERGQDVYAYLEGGESRPKGLGQAVSRVAFEWTSRIGAALSAAKLPRAIQWAEEMERAGEPAMIGGPYVEPIRVLGSRPGWGLIEGATSPARRHEIVTAFRDGKLRGVATTIRAGGVGINCQRAAFGLVIDPDWVPAWTRQWFARMRRTGQTRAVQPDFLRVEGHPMEVRKQELVRKKRRLMQAVDASAVRPGVAA